MRKRGTEKTRVTRFDALSASVARILCSSGSFCLVFESRILLTFSLSLVRPFHVTTTADVSASTTSTLSLVFFFLFCHLQSACTFLPYLLYPHPFTVGVCVCVCLSGVSLRPFCFAPRDTNDSCLTSSLLHSYLSSHRASPLSSRFSCRLPPSSVHRSLTDPQTHPD